MEQNNFLKINQMNSFWKHQENVNYRGDSGMSTPVHQQP